jgi:predicted CopG family antitoxin
MSMQTTISFKISESLKTKLIKRVAQNKKSISDFIRELIEEKLGDAKPAQSPFMKLLGTLTEQESVEMSQRIRSARSNKNLKNIL